MVPNALAEARASFEALTQAGQLSKEALELR